MKSLGLHDVPSSPLGFVRTMRRQQFLIPPAFAVLGKAITSTVGASVIVAAMFLSITAQAQTPFYGTPFIIPGTIQAEDFDLGGQDVAYHDNVPGNAGGQYRTSEDVDVVVSLDSAGGAYVVNNFEK